LVNVPALGTAEQRNFANLPEARLIEVPIVMPSAPAFVKWE
jgi:hypothetical protein